MWCSQILGDRLCNHAEYSWSCFYTGIAGLPTDKYVKLELLTLQWLESHNLIICNWIYSASSYHVISVSTYFRHCFHILPEIETNLCELVHFDSLRVSEIYWRNRGEFIQLNLGDTKTTLFQISSKISIQRESKSKIILIQIFFSTDSKKPSSWANWMIFLRLNGLIFLLPTDRGQISDGQKKLKTWI